MLRDIVLIVRRFFADERRRPQRQDRVEPIWLSEGDARRTQEILRSFGREVNREHEGIVYWCGVAVGGGGIVTTLVVPNADSGPGFVETTPQENAAILSLLDRHDVVLLGQAHSHPHGAGAKHSHGDDLWTFSPFEGAMSVVVPDYAEATRDFTKSWGVHRFKDGRYVTVAHRNHSGHLRIVPSVIDRRR